MLLFFGRHTDWLLARTLKVHYYCIYVYQMISYIMI